MSRQNQIWKIEITTLDVTGEPFCAIVIDVYSRLLVATAVFESPGDIGAVLDEAYALSGSPKAIWIDRGFKFSSARIEEWGAQQGVAVVYGPPFGRPPIPRDFAGD